MHINICTCDWGEARRQDLHALLVDTASHIHRELRQPVEGTINVVNLPSLDGPRTIYRQDGKGPFDITLTARDLKWAKFAYQFAHEYCHVQSGYERLRDNPNNWFHESICELASLYTLRSMGERWLKKPPYPNWATYAPHLTAYANNIISARTLVGVSDRNFAAWPLAEETELRKDPYQREKNKLVACRLLGLFEECPRGWNAITVLPDSKALMLDYLKEWRVAAEPDDRPFLDQVTAVLTEGWTTPPLRSFST